MKNKRFTILFCIIFACLLGRMSMNNSPCEKQRVHLLYDHCSHNTIEPLKDSTGSIQIDLIKTFSMEESRKQFINKLRRL